MHHTLRLHRKRDREPLRKQRIFLRVFTPVARRIPFRIRLGVRREALLCAIRFHGDGGAGPEEGFVGGDAALF